MFDIYCPRHASRVLIFASGIDGIDNTDDGIQVRYHCTCGYRGVWHTGRARADATTDSTASSAA